MREAPNRPDGRTVEVTVTFAIREEGMTLADLETGIWSSVQEAARQAIASACEIIEADALARVSGPATLDRRRPLDVLTRFGWVRLMRWYQRDDVRDRYHYPLDGVLKLHPRQHASPWVVRQAAALAARLSYREAAEFLSGQLGTSVDHRTLHSLVSQSEADRPGDAGGRLNVSGRRVSRVGKDVKVTAKPDAKASSNGSV